jgi:hypothetical protein
MNSNLDQQYVNDTHEGTTPPSNHRSPSTAGDEPGEVCSNNRGFMDSGSEVGEANGRTVSGELPSPAPLLGGPPSTTDVARAIVAYAKKQDDPTIRFTGPWDKFTLLLFKQGFLVTWGHTDMAEVMRDCGDQVFLVHYSKVEGIGEATVLRVPLRVFHPNLPPTTPWFDSLRAVLEPNQTGPSGERLWVGSAAAFFAELISTPSTIPIIKTQTPRSIGRGLSRMARNPSSGVTRGGNKTRFSTYTIQLQPN